MRAGRFISIIGLACIAVVCASRRDARAADWLSGPEREFFGALGGEYRIDGNSTRRVATVETLPTIAARAPQPLQSRIKTIADSFERMKVTPDEKRQFEALMAKGEQAVRRELLGAVLGSLAGEDSFDAAVNATNGIVKEGTVQEAWDLQTKWILRGLAARAVADNEMAKITGDLERRVGTSLATTDLPLTVVSDQNKLCLTAKAGRPLSSPIVQVILYRKSTGGAWTALNAGSGKLLELIGVDGMSGSTQGKGITLAMAQEMGMNLPMRTTALLPDLAAGQRVTMSLNVADVVAEQVDRVESQVWTDVGWIKFDSVPGLPEVVTAIGNKRLEERRAIAARATAGFGNPTAAQFPRQPIVPGSGPPGTLRPNPGPPGLGPPGGLAPGGLAPGGSLPGGSLPGVTPPASRPSGRLGQSGGNAQANGGGRAGQPSPFGPGGLGGSGFGGSGFGAPGFGAPAANGGRPNAPEEPGRPLTAEERKARNQQEAVLNQQALRLLRMAEAALKRKQPDLARNYCDQIIAQAPDSPSAKSAKIMLDRLNK